MEDATDLIICKLMKEDVAAAHSFKGVGKKAAFVSYTNILECMFGNLFTILVYVTFF